MLKRRGVAITLWGVTHYTLLSSARCLQLYMLGWSREMHGPVIPVSYEDRLRHLAGVWQTSGALHAVLLRQVDPIAGAQFAWPFVRYVD